MKTVTDKDGKIWKTANVAGFMKGAKVYKLGSEICLGDTTNDKKAQQR